MKMNKKAQQLTFENAGQFALILVLIGIIAGAGAIALASFRDTSYTARTKEVNNFTAQNATSVRFAASNAVTCTGVSFKNSSSQNYDATKFTIVNCEAILKDNTQDGTNFEATYDADVINIVTDITNNTLTGSEHFSLQLPTVGTLLGVALILLVVIGVFAMGFIRR